MQKFHHQAPICRATTSGIKSVANLKNFSLEKKKKKEQREKCNLYQRWNRNVMCNNEELVQEATLQQQYPNIVHVT
jgi:hypothetical protein